jgi:hypothetical protein
MGGTPSKNVNLTGEVAPSHFDLHRMVGRGTFGLVRHRVVPQTLLSVLLIPFCLGSCRTLGRSIGGV